VIAGGGKQATGTTAHATEDLEQWTWGTVADPAQNEVCFLGTHGEQWCRGSMTELLTLSTVGLTTDTTNNLAAGGFDHRVGRGARHHHDHDHDELERGRRDHRRALLRRERHAHRRHDELVPEAPAGLRRDRRGGPGAVGGREGPHHCTGANPGAGVIRITVFYRRFIAPTS
jgi:hypothetical protein